MSPYLDEHTVHETVAAESVCVFACVSGKTGAGLCTTHSTINTYTKRRATQYKMQLKFWAKSYLPAWINSNSLESILALLSVSDCSCTGLTEGHAATSMGITCRPVKFLYVRCTLITLPCHRIDNETFSMSIDRVWCGLISTVPPLLLTWIDSVSSPGFKCHFLQICHSFLLLDASHCVPTVDSYRRGLPLSSDPSALFIEAEKTRRKM